MQIFLFRLDHLEILSYGISITTLEEVFLKVAEGDDLHRGGAPGSLTAKNSDREEIDDFQLNKVRITNSFQLFGIQFSALVQKRIQYFKKDIKGIIAEIFIPIIVIIIGLCMLLIRFDSDQEARVLIPSSLYSSNFKLLFGGKGNIEINDNFRFEKVFDYFGNYNNLQDFDENLFKNKAVGCKGGYYLKNDITTDDDLSYLIAGDTVNVDIYPLMMNLIHTSLLRFYLNDPEFQIKVINHPLPYTKTEKDIIKNIGGIFAVFIFAIGMSLIPASLIVFIVKEKQYNIKHQQMVSGASQLAYWSSHFFVDFIKALIPTIFAALMCQAFDIQGLIEDDCWGAVLLLFIFYAAGISNFSYFFSFFFKDYGSAQTLSFIIHFLFGGVAPIILFILRIIGGNTKSIGDLLANIFRVLPSFSFGFGIMNIAK